jgi:hypothetical protein
MRSASDAFSRRALLLSALACGAVARAEPGGLPAVAARYRVTWTDADGSLSRQQWFFLRQPQQVALVKGDVEEIWRRDPRNGDVSLLRVWRAQRLLVDYPAGELRALNVVADWRALSMLDHEHRPGEALDWDTTWQLPRRLLRQAGGRSLQWSLLDARASPAADWPIPAAAADGFDRLDAADFGDMEYDPRVRQLLARDAAAGWRRP